MTRASLPPAVPRASPLRLAGAATALVLACGSVHAQSAPAPSPSVAPLVALLALVLALALLLWGLRAHRRTAALADDLQRSRAEQHAMRGVLDVWQWRSDAQHRLVEWRAPALPSAHGPALRLGARLTDLFAGGSTMASLQSRLDLQAPMQGYRVNLAPGAAAQAASYLLHAQPLLDPSGQFAGYVGTARSVNDGVTSLLTDVLMALPSPVLRVALPTRGQPPRLLKHNPASQAWILPPPPEREPDWDDVLKGVPGALKPVLEQAVARPPDTPVDAPEGWNLRVHRIPCAQPGLPEEVLLVFQRASAPAPVEPPSDDSESFSYTVSHDLRAPIRVVEGFTKIVKEDYGHALDRVGNDHLDRVLGAAARMNSMIDSLLALSQLSSRPLSRQPVNMSMLAGYIIDDLRRQSPDRDVEVHIEPGLQCHGDATLLRVVLENLLGNAWKYTGKCRVGRIWMERSEHEGRPAITVRDNGAGFDMRFADRLFGVFQRLHSANDFQGTGIGLASVRRIVRRHGGDIWAEAEVDRGARFQFWI
ncbi:sensor histidine kinase [Piscinibacter gummiphilus]|uniref:sensor histidine kinase n=1 Tax=Piscinibacter gummiphilus TaxID=946333 RepID=UPI0012F4DAF0|nr:ATP-binding protein [Piscinibacter gummiphilus]